MAKKVSAYIKLQVKAGSANPAPPVGPALGQHGVNIMEFCKAFNAQTAQFEKGAPVPVIITVYADRSFTFILKTPPATFLLKKAAGITSGSSNALKTKVGSVTHAQLLEIAKTYEKVDTSKLYTADEAVNLVKDIATAKFVESVDVSINLGIDPKKSDQNIRGAIVLPHGSGRQVRVCVFTQGENAEAAKAAGAEFVGMQELAAQIKGGMMDFDVVIASPDAMRVVGQLGQILGPRGLMPNPKVGTVTRDVAQAVKNAKAGQVAYRNDKSAIVHTTIGLANFSAADLKDNLAALISAIRKAKPATSKGVFLKKINLSTTMGVGVNVDPASIADK